MHPDEVTRRIVEALPGAAVTVRDLTGTSDHFAVRVICERFEGLPSIQRHRLVHAPLRDVLGGALHAIDLVTRTPAEQAAETARAAGAAESRS